MPFSNFDPRMKYTGKLHYICISQTCMTDVFRDESFENYQICCPKCGKAWNPLEYQEGSYARGVKYFVEEPSPMNRCVKHDKKELCEECERIRVQSQ